MKMSGFVKMLCLVLALVMMLSLVLCGCGNQEETPEGTTTAPTSGQSNSPYVPEEDDESPFQERDPNYPNAIVLPEDREPSPAPVPPTQPAATEPTEGTVPAAPVEPDEPVSGGNDENALPDDRS